MSDACCVKGTHRINAQSSMPCTTVLDLLSHVHSLKLASQINMSAKEHVLYIAKP